MNQDQDIPPQAETRSAVQIAQHETNEFMRPLFEEHGAGVVMDTALRLSARIVAALAALPSGAAAADEAERLRAIIERDRTRAGVWVERFRAALDARAWMRDGRGSYAWDDPRIMDEFRQHHDDLTRALACMEKELHVSDLADSPGTQVEVDSARAALAAAPAAGAERLPASVRDALTEYVAGRQQAKRNYETYPSWRQQEPDRIGELESEIAEVSAFLDVAPSPAPTSAVLDDETRVAVWLRPETVERMSKSYPRGEIGRALAAALAALASRVEREAEAK